MSKSVAQHPRRLASRERGRAQDPSRDALIINAALNLLVEKGYHALTMTDVATRAGVSKATLYRRWATKADVVADAVETLNPMESPRYSGTSLRDDLLMLMGQLADCDDRPEIVTATFATARSDPDLYRTLSDRFSQFVRAELSKLIGQADVAGATPTSAVELEVLSDTTIALLAHHAGPAGKAVERARLKRIVDHVLMVLITGKRAAE